MGKRFTLILAAFFMCLWQMPAQTTKVAGEVFSDADGLPVIGAYVYVKGNEKTGAVTDLDGKFELAGVPASADFPALRTDNWNGRRNYPTEPHPHYPSRPTY